MFNKQYEFFCLQTSSLSLKMDCLSDRFINKAPDQKNHASLSMIPKIIRCRRKTPNNTVSTIVCFIAVHIHICCITAICWTVITSHSACHVKACVTRHKKGMLPIVTAGLWADRYKSADIRMSTAKFKTNAWRPSLQCVCCICCSAACAGLVSLHSFLLIIPINMKMFHVIS